MIKQPSSACEQRDFLPGELVSPAMRGARGARGGFIFSFTSPPDKENVFPSDSLITRILNENSVLIVLSTYPKRNFMCVFLMGAIRYVRMFNGGSHESLWDKI